MKSGNANDSMTADVAINHTADTYEISCSEKTDAGGDARYHDQTIERITATKTDVGTLDT